MPKRHTSNKIRLKSHEQSDIYDIVQSAMGEEEDSLWSLVQKLEASGKESRKQCGFAAGVLYALERQSAHGTR